MVLSLTMFNFPVSYAAGIYSASSRSRYPRAHWRLLSIGFKQVPLYMYISVYQE